MPGSWLAPFHREKAHREATAVKSNVAKINNVADLIVETLQAAGMARIFGLVRG